MKIKVTVQLKPAILDPQGKAVEQGLQTLGFKARHVRIGRSIEFDMEASTPEEAREQAQKMCEALLVNPIMEKAIIEVLP
jgi:phosphoribosylformylglycinamidine synthase